MVKDIQAIDLTNEMDILYLYKNIRELPDLLDQFHKIKFWDLSFSLFCYGIVEKAVLEELGEFFVDHEMEELVRATLNGPKSDVSMPDGKPEDTMFYINHLDVLLRPLVDICNKQIVDLIYYVFKKSGVNHFGFLFDMFTGESQLIELHLLVAKGMRDRSFDLSDIKECLEREEVDAVTTDTTGNTVSPPNEPEPPLPSEDDGVSLGKLSPSPNPIIPLPFSEKPKDLHIDVGYFPSDSSDEELSHVKSLTAKPFKEKPTMNPAFHLQRAKELLLSYKDNDASFFIENVTTYLSMKFDKKLFAEYLSYKCYNPFSINLKKLPNVPFFFYANSSVAKILAPVAKVARKDPYEFSTQEGVCTVPINSYVLKYFLEFCHATFFDINSPLGDYILISKSLRYFVEFYKDPAFFKIFYELLNCKISKIEADIKENLLSDLSLYVDVFYGNPRVALDAVDEELENWTLKLYPSHKKIAQSLYDDGSKTEDCKKPSAIPSIGEDSKSVLTNAYINSSFYTDIEEKISRHLLDLFSKNYNEDQVEVDEFIESLIQEISSDPHLKIYVLRSVEKIHDKLCVHESTSGHNGRKDLHRSCFSKVLENLKDFPKLNWRYKKVFLSKLSDLERLDVDRIWVKKTLENDRVFYIKNMVSNLK